MHNFINFLILSNTNQNRWRRVVLFLYISIYDIGRPFARQKPEIKEAALLMMTGQHRIIPYCEKQTTSFSDVA